MPTCWLKDVILATWCRWIYFSLLHLYFRFWFVTIKKNACQYLYFKMLLYISQNADMSAKWRHLGIIISLNWFYDVTFVFQFWICDFKKKNACKYLYFKYLLYISQNADMSAKWRHLGIIMSSNWFYDVTVVFQFWICDFLKKNACQYLYFKMLLYISQNADMSGKWRNFGIMMSVFRFLIITFTF